MGRDPLKQQLRATVFRNCEIDVRTVEGLEEAQRLCRVQQFDMVLLAGDHHSEEASLICDELRKVAPRQRVAVLVGPPKYLSEIGVQRRRPTCPRINSQRKLQLVEAPQATQWQALFDRLIVAG
jgi:hypothetical protein